MQTLKTTQLLVIVSALSFWLLRCQTTEKPLVNRDELKQEFTVFSNETHDSSAAGLSQGVDKSLKDSLDLLEKDQKNAAVLANVGQLYLLKGDIKQAETYAKKTLTVKFKDVRARLILAEVYYRRGQYDLASLYLESLDGDRSKDSKVLNLLALIEYKTGHKTNTMALLKKGMTLNSEDAAIRMNLGALYYEFHMLNLAATQYERVIIKYPEHIDARLNLAVVKLARHDLGAAKTDFEMILGKDKNNLLALYGYAYALFLEKNYDDSSEYLKKYIALVNEDTQQLQAAFGLADQIKNAQSGKTSISDQEINQLSNRLAKSKNPKAKTAKVEAKLLRPSVETTQDETLPATVDIKPTTPPSEKEKPVVKKASEDISDLESILAH